MSRLSIVDSVWLDVVSEGPPYAIGALLVLEGPAPTLAELKAFLHERTDSAERMRQRLVEGTLKIRQATWEDVEPDFDHHVTEVTIGPDAGQAELERVVSDVMSRHMDEDRPLWDFTLVTGLEHQRWAIVNRLHHVVADGQGALLLTGRLIDVDVEGGTSLTEALEALVAAGGSTTEEKSTDSSVLLADAARRGGDLALRAMRTLRSKSAMTEALSTAADAAKSRADTIGTQLPSSPGVLAGDPGDPRTWHTTEVSLADVKRVKATLGGTVNDIVMTLMSGGYRSLVSAWGMDPETISVRVLVPVSLRRPGDLTTNNQVAGLLVTLPLAGDTMTRFQDIRAHLDDVKDLGTAPLAAPLYEVIDKTVPAFVQTFAIRTAAGSVVGAFADTIVTNVPGPQFPVYVMGRRAVVMAPMIPVGDPTRLTTGVVSYDGLLHFGSTGGEGIGDGVHQVGQGVQDALRDLLTATEES